MVKKIVFTGAVSDYIWTMLNPFSLKLTLTKKTKQTLSLKGI